MTGDSAESSAEVSHAVERVGEVCEECSWTLTIEEIIRRERDKYSRTPSAERVRSKLGSLGEGHAYFNRGHRVRRVVSPQQIERHLSALEERRGSA